MVSDLICCHQGTRWRSALRTTHSYFYRPNQFNYSNGTDHYHYQRCHNRQRTAEQTLGELFLPTKAGICLRDVSFPELHAIFTLLICWKGWAGSTVWLCKHTRTGFELIAEPCSHILAQRAQLRSMTLCRKSKAVGFSCGCFGIQNNWCNTYRRGLYLQSGYVNPRY